jgi:hypothetical protein
MELVCMVDLGRGKFGIWRDINSLGKWMETLVQIAWKYRYEH